eukprot:COSAG01_NODE_26984_length_697_cov_2.033445_1_plen_85_part_00
MCADLPQLPWQPLPPVQNEIAQSTPWCVASHGYVQLVHGARSPSRALRGRGNVIAPWPAARCIKEHEAARMAHATLIIFWYGPQ